jgi:hypothetical protein
MEIDPVVVISMPLLEPGAVIQPCTCAVMSTSTNEFAALAVAVVNTLPTVGWVLKVALFSAHSCVASANDKVPGVGAEFT